MLVKTWWMWFSKHFCWWASIMVPEDSIWKCLTVPEDDVWKYFSPVHICSLVDNKFVLVRFHFQTENGNWKLKVPQYRFKIWWKVLLQNVDFFYGFVPEGNNCSNFANAGIELSSIQASHFSVLAFLFRFCEQLSFLLKACWCSWATLCFLRAAGPLFALVRHNRYAFKKGHMLT